MLENCHRRRSIAYKIKATAAHSKAFRVSSRENVGLLRPGQRKILNCSLGKEGGEEGKECQIRVYYVEMEEEEEEGGDEVLSFEMLFSRSNGVKRTPTILCKGESCVIPSSASPSTRVIKFADALRLDTELVIEEQADAGHGKSLLFSKVTRWKVAMLFVLAEYVFWQIVACIASIFY